MHGAVWVDRWVREGMAPVLQRTTLVVSALAPSVCGGGGGDVRGRFEVKFED